MSPSQFCFSDSEIQAVFAKSGRLTLDEIAAILGVTLTGPLRHKPTDAGRRLKAVLLKTTWLDNDAPRQSDRSHRRNKPISFWLRAD